MSNGRILWAALFALVLAGGCIQGRIDQPDDYLPIATGPQYDQRFLSVEGNVIACRTVANPKGGTLDYWTKAVTKELTERAGYRLKSAETITADGRDGTLFEFRTPVGGVEHTYLLAMFVDRSTIALVEAAGETEQVEKDRDRLLATIRSIH